MAASREKSHGCGAWVGAWFVLGFAGTGGIDEVAVEARQLLVGGVDHRVVKIGSFHTGFEVVAVKPGADATELLEFRDVGVRRGLTHSEDGSNEHLS